MIYANLIYENKLNFVKVYKVKDSMNTKDSMQTIHTINTKKLVLIYVDFNKFGLINLKFKKNKKGVIEELNICH